MLDSIGASAILSNLGLFSTSDEPAVLGDVQRSGAGGQVDSRSVVHCRSRSNAHSDFAALQGAVAHRHNTPGCGLSLQLRNLDGQTFTLGVVGLAVANGESLAEVALSIAITDDEVLRQLMVLVDSLHSLAQLVTAIQAGFSTYWGPYVYSHYRDEQERICRVHDVLNLLIFGFFCVLVMFEDIVFVIFPDKRGCLAIFPLLMLAVVFNILCEGTVYGNSIARKPWHDTIGIGLGALSNFGLCALLVPAFGLTGAALALAASNGLAFLYRSITGQMYYRTVASYPKTISGFLLAFAVTAIGTLLWQHFFIKFALVGVILFIYCTLYRAQLARLWRMALGILRGIFHRK